jgi:hypothetical protein
VVIGEGCCIVQGQYGWRSGHARRNHKASANGVCPNTDANSIAMPKTPSPEIPFPKSLYQITFPQGKMFNAVP